MNEVTGRNVKAEPTLDGARLCFCSAPIWSRAEAEPRVAEPRAARTRGSAIVKIGFSVVNVT